MRTELLEQKIEARYAWISAQRDLEATKRPTGTPNTERYYEMCAKLAELEDVLYWIQTPDTEEK